MASCRQETPVGRLNKSRKGYHHLLLCTAIFDLRLFIPLLFAVELGW